MAREINDINKTVSTAELVETIMYKLGVTSTIEELLELYNMTLPLGNAEEAHFQGFTEPMGN